MTLEASGRHVHLSQDDIDELFGKGYSLTPKRELSQSGQFLAEEQVKLIGKKGIIEKAAILGPARSHSQVEVSKTDSIKLGIDAPLRFSGNIKDSASVFIASSENVIKLEEGVIIAKRHIHMTPEDAEKLAVEDGDIVSVEALTERPVVFKDVLIRVNEDYSLNMHIDYDEANACLFSKGDKAKLIK
ncbi:phosphate propanoyltransferase [Halanaerobium congolense]|uniref:phosphate propanoyltransferase n=1 Tax=Halanaerobium congolense TaxID=54121 RepID=UPI0009D6BC91|nr:phosphate propanoyltransferase [Halanaerobium congolense]